MEIRYENINIHHTDETVDTVTVTHIYSEHGHFLQGGWHIQLGSDRQVSDFEEVIDEGVTHEIPASLPDVDIYEQDDPEEEATVEDYEAVLSEIFGEEQEDDEGEINTTTNTNVN